MTVYALTLNTNAHNTSFAKPTDIHEVKNDKGSLGKPLVDPVYTMVSTEKMTKPRMHMCDTF